MTANKCPSACVAAPSYKRLCLISLFMTGPIMQFLILHFLTTSQRLLVLIFIVLTSASMSLVAQDKPIVITNVSMIDVEKGVLIEQATILLNGDSIESVIVNGAGSDMAKIPEGATVIDASGKFAIPGLWDMHIHWYDPATMALFPINGITGVRVMFGAPMHHSWRTSFDKGTKLGPRMLIGSLIIDGAEPVWPGSIVASDAAGGKASIDKAIKAKSDFAKVYSLLSREAYFAIAEEAKAQNLPFDGHVPMMVSVREASSAGQRSMEHLYETILACSSREKELRELQTASLGESGTPRDLYENSELRKQISISALESFDQKKADELFEMLARNRSWQCPTLTVLRNLTYLTEPEIQNNPNLKYLPKYVRAQIAPAQQKSPRDEEAQLRAEKTFKKNLALVGEMHRAGVPIIAGTDCLNPFCLPGFSLHTELQLLVKAGLPPIDALGAATINAARFQGTETRMGSISAGKVADLVLLDANPLEEIANTERIHAVVTRGRLIDRAELDRMLEELESD